MEACRNHRKSEIIEEVTRRQVWLHNAGEKEGGCKHDTTGEQTESGR